MSDIKRDPHTMVREALRAAADGPEPDMSRLLASVPAILAEARRRRLEDAETPLAALVPLASRLIPRLAAATAALALLVTVTLAIDVRSRRGERTDIDAVLLGSGDAVGDGGAGPGVSTGGAADGGEGGSLDDLLLARPGVPGDENG